ncbi:MAG: winged helix-turn-helix transcriptional regulator [Methanobrevibacter sp. CfCl-M3]
MIITLTKKQKAINSIHTFEKEYGSIERLRKAQEETGSMKMLVDLENWEYYLKNPEEEVFESKSIVTNKIALTDLKMEILDFIKKEKPKSIRELSRMIDKDVGIIHPKVKELEQDGLIEFKTGVKNSKIPYLNYDEITIVI